MLLLLLLLLLSCSLNLAFSPPPANACRRRMMVRRESSAGWMGASTVLLSLPPGIPILMCPAQLSVPNDYGPMFEELGKRGHAAYAAKLTRLGWISGLLPSAVTSDYLQGTLKPSRTLRFYYDAIDAALVDLKANHPGSPFHVVGHSIGGWIARGWMAERCSEKDRMLIKTFTTLGSPCQSPKKLAFLDQTRGLLAFIEKKYPGCHHPDIRYLSVIGTGVKGSVPGSVEEMLAFASYLPVGGKGSLVGDGIIPVDVACVKGAELIKLDKVKHSGFVPAPGKAVRLPKSYLWYGSPSAVDIWLPRVNTDDKAKTKKILRLDEPEEGRMTGVVPKPKSK